MNVQLQRIVDALSPSVVRIRYTVGEDWSGDPAVFFRVVLSDEASCSGNLGGVAVKVKGLVQTTMELEYPNHQAYFNFRSQSEQTLLKNPEWE
jgi:hypothetical protein